MYKALRRFQLRGYVDLEDPHQHHPAMAKHEMCRICGKIHPTQNYHRRNHWKPHWPAKYRSGEPFGALPEKPFWASNRMVGLKAAQDAEIMDLVDPTPITEFCLDLLEEGVAIPASFRKWGVKAVWKYWLRYKSNPKISFQPSFDIVD